MLRVEATVYVSSVAYVAVCAVFAVIVRALLACVLVVIAAFVPLAAWIPPRAVCHISALAAGRHGIRARRARRGFVRLAC